MFERYGKGLGGHMVNMTEPLATALHSWANQCVDCACGCRGPLSCNRLQAQGLFGVLAHVPGRSPDKNVRHLSAREMALLTGFPKTEGWTDHQRLLCAGVGQLASPLQSAWVFTSILNHLIEHGFFHGDITPPQQVLACVAAEVFKLRDTWYQNHCTVTMELFQESIEKFLEPTVSHAQEPKEMQDLTPSQDDDLARSIADIEKKVQSGAQVAPAPNGQVNASQVCTEPTNPMPVEMESKDHQNSQRSGRKDLEEKKSGVTQKTASERAARTRQEGHQTASERDARTRQDSGETASGRDARTLTRARPTPVGSSRAERPKPVGLCPVLCTA